MANRVHGCLSKFCGWLCERDIIAASPMVGVKPPIGRTCAIAC